MKKWVIHLLINEGEYGEVLELNASVVTKISNNTICVDHICMEFTCSMIEIEEIKEIKK